MLMCCRRRRFEPQSCAVVRAADVDPCGFEPQSEAVVGGRRLRAVCVGPHEAALARRRKQFGHNFKVLQDLKVQGCNTVWATVVVKWQWMVQRKMLRNQHHHWTQQLCDIKSIKGYL